MQRMPFCRLAVSWSILQLSLGVSPAPGGVGRWTSQGPNDAHVFALAVDPSATSTVYAGVAPIGGRGGLYKTLDGGARWTAVDAELPTSIWIEALAIDPVATSTVYCGHRFGGVFKTSDGGLHWQQVHATAGPHLAIDPGTPTTVYASGANGVSKSTDAGETWSSVNNGLSGSPAGVLVIDPSDPSTLYVASGERIFKSVDGGAHWQPADNGLGVGSVTALVIDRHDPSTLYAGGRGVYRSTNGGQQWSPINEGLVDGYSIAQVSVLVIDPMTPSTVYAGDDLGLGLGGIYKTTDGGQRWILQQSLPRVLALAVDPSDPSSIYAGTANFLEFNYHSSGLFKSTDAGDSWEVSNRGLSNTHIFALAIDPVETTTLLAGFDEGLARSMDGGATWVLESFVDERVTALTIDPQTPSTVYAGVDGLISSGLSKSLDGGLTWASVGLEGRIAQVVIDPINPHNVYAVTLTLGAEPLGSVYRSSDGGGGWIESSAGLPEDTLRLLAIDPSDPAILYAGTGDGVFKTTDRGASWAAANAGLDNEDVRALVVDPADSARVYAGTADGVFKTTNGASAWFATRLSGPPVTALAIDPVDPAKVYAGTSGRVVRSLDGGEHWADFASGLENADIRSLVVDPRDPGTLHAGTNTGVFDIETPNTCLADADTLCLNGDRFRVEVEWQDFQGVGGDAQVVQLGAGSSPDSGLFWFFDPNNWEMLIKVLDGCAINGHFWVFSAATTDVAYTLRVTDTESGEARQYVNPLGVAAAATTDTSAFATCPTAQ